MGRFKNGTKVWLRHPIKPYAAGTECEVTGDTGCGEYMVDMGDGYVMWVKYHELRPATRIAASIRAAARKLKSPQLAG